MTAVLTGASGQLGSAIARAAAVIPLDRSDADLSHPETLDGVLDRLQPDLVINCAAYTAVDEAEQDEETAHAINAVAVGRMASWCAGHGARFVTFSTDYVFDGSLSRPYVESDATRPINAYGRSKEAGERLALESHPASLVIRTSWVLSSTHRNFLTMVLDRAAGGSVAVVDDQYGCPTIAGDLAVGVLNAIRAGASGLLHLTNTGQTTWFELAQTAVALAGMNPESVHPVSSKAFPRPAPRPQWSVLGSERLETWGLGRLPAWQASLPRVVAEISGH